METASNRISMRLLSYFSLRSHGKDVKVGYPLILQIEHLEVRESECNEDFMRHIIPTLEWETLKKCAEAVSIVGLPAAYDVSLLDDSDFLSFVHNLLLDIHVCKGKLVCPETGRVYPIADGIPNMMSVLFMILLDTVFAINSSVYRFVYHVCVTRILQQPKF